MTLNDIIYDIKNTAYNCAISDDVRLSNRQIKKWINDYRALLIRRDIDKGKTFSDNITQTLGCVKLITVDKAECCNVDSTCPVLRTELQLPKTLEFSQMDGITYVGTVTRDKGYELTTFTSARWDQYNKYTSKLPKAILFNQYVYIVNEDFLQYINIQGVFADPTEAGKFNNCEGDPCYTDNSSYPISDYMVPTIKQMIFVNELKISLSTLADTTNDGNGNINQP